MAPTRQPAPCPSFLGSPLRRRRLLQPKRTRLRSKKSSRLRTELAPLARCRSPLPELSWRDGARMKATQMRRYVYAYCARLRSGLGFSASAPESPECGLVGEIGRARSHAIIHGTMNHGELEGWSEPGIPITGARPPPLPVDNVLPLGAHRRWEPRGPRKGKIKSPSHGHFYWPAGFAAAKW